MRGLPAATVLAAVSLTGCATLPNGHRWGGDVTIAPGWARVRSAAVQAASDPWVWAPLASAAALQVDHFDHRVSHWGRTRNPVFGSKANATLWSDRLRSASVGVDIATVLLTPSGDVGGTWLLDKAKGYLVNLAAATTAIESTTLLQHSVRRERPNDANDHSFPSGHSAASSVYTRLATLNLEEIPMGRAQREALDASLHALSFATAWARVEADGIILPTRWPAWQSATSAPISSRAPSRASMRLGSASRSRLCPGAAHSRLPSRSARGVDR